MKYIFKSLFFLIFATYNIFALNVNFLYNCKDLGYKDKLTFHNKELCLLKLEKKDKKILKFITKKQGLDKKYKPDDLIKLPKDLCINKEKAKYISWKAYIPLLKMIADAEKKGIKLKVLSAYRSYAYQKSLYNHYLNKMNCKRVKSLVALPGHSQHQTGLAVDFNSVKDEFYRSKEYKWLKENAYKYGFSLSYPNNLKKITGYIFEPWHYMYVGKKNALLIKYYYNNNQKAFIKRVKNYKLISKF